MGQPPLDLSPVADAEERVQALSDALGAQRLPGGTLRVRGAGDVTRLPGYEAGDWWVQDAAAALPARLLGPVAGKRVLEIGAAPGGKTAQLAAAGARVTAVDRSAPRLTRLRENLARLGLEAEIVEADALDWRPQAPADAVLLDVPCTATGTIRRHPDIPHGRSLPTWPDSPNRRAGCWRAPPGWWRPAGSWSMRAARCSPKSASAKWTHSSRRRRNSRVCRCARARWRVSASPSRRPAISAHCPAIGRNGAGWTASTPRACGTLAKLVPDPAMQQELRIAASVLAADFSCLGEEVRAISDAGADWLHVDVMDGHFVPNLTIGAGVVAALRPHSGRPFDVHLMVTPPDPFIEPFAEAGADCITVHAEAGAHLHRTLQRIKGMGKRAGVALNPATPARTVEPVLDDIDLVLVMSVNPGFGGQRFIPSQIGKIEALRALIDASGRTVDLSVDGGIDERTAGLASGAGADVLVAGSASFAGGRADYPGNIARLREAGEAGRTASLGTRARPRAIGASVS